MKRTSEPRGPKRMKELGYHKVELWLDEALFDRLYEVCHAMGRTRAAVVKELLENWVFSQRFLSNAELARLAKDELENRR